MGEGAGKRPSRLLADRGLGRVGRLMDRDQAHFPRDPEPPVPDAAGLLGRLLLLIFLKMQFTTLPLFFNKELCKEPASRHFAADLDNESQEEQYPTCEHCGKTFLKRNKLNRHINEAHLDLKKYSCDTCGKLFKRPQHLKRHLLSHNNERPFKCDYESKVAPTSRLPPIIHLQPSSQEAREAHPRTEENLSMRAVLFLHFQEESPKSPQTRT